MSFYCSGVSAGKNDASIDITFTGGDPSYERRRCIRLTVYGTSYQGSVYDSTNVGGSSSYFSVHIYGLTKATTYYFSAELGYYTNGVAQWTGTTCNGSFTTAGSSIVVAKWSWSASNGTATASETQNAYKVIQGTLSSEYFSSKVWNDIVDKVALVRTAMSYTWDTNNLKYFTADNCKVSSGSTLSAKVYNSVKYNIGSIAATGIQDVSPGDEVLGKYFTAITNAINVAIDNL